MVHVTAAIILKQNKVLICQRGEGGPCAYLWEFPGGKQEEGESLVECLIREVKEELDLTIEVSDICDEFSYNYGDGEMNFTFYNAQILSGIIKPTVHESVLWVDVLELGDFVFCPADVSLVRRLIESNKK